MGEMDDGEKYVSNKLQFKTVLRLLNCISFDFRIKIFSIDFKPSMAT